MVHSRRTKQLFLPEWAEEVMLLTLPAYFKHDFRWGKENGVTKIETLVQKTYHQLSKSQQKVAQYLLSEPQTFAIKSAAEIGRDIGVSETTVIRFCYSLKLSGFTDLQKKIRQTFLYPSSLDEYYAKNLQLADGPHFHVKVMEKDRQNITQAINNIDEKNFQKTVNQLIHADKIFILGLRSSFAAAQWLSFTLNILRDDVHLLRPDLDDLFVKVPQWDENCLFIAISFHRYLKETIHLAKLAKEQGAFVCGITDSPVAPISKHAHALLAISLQAKSTIDAAPALFSLLNALVAGYTVQDKERVEKRKKQYESLQMNHLFVSD